MHPRKLIFLPGAGGDPAFWKPASDLITFPATRCLLGWPGHGHAPPDPRVSKLRDLAALVQQQVTEPCALLAQSMGGIVAVLAVLQRPDLITHLVLAATSGGIKMADLGAADWRP